MDGTTHALSYFGPSPVEITIADNDEVIMFLTSDRDTTTTVGAEGRDIELFIEDPNLTPDNVNNVRLSIQSSTGATLGVGSQSSGVRRSEDIRLFSVEGAFAIDGTSDVELQTATTRGLRTGVISGTVSNGRLPLRIRVYADGRTEAQDTITFTLLRASQTGDLPSGLRPSVTLFIPENGALPALCDRSRVILEAVQSGTGNLTGTCTQFTDAEWQPLVSLRMTIDRSDDAADAEPPGNLIQRGDFNGFNRVTSLDIRGRGGSGSANALVLENGVFDDVLDTLTTLSIRTGTTGWVRSAVGLGAPSGTLTAGGGVVRVPVTLTRALPVTLDLTVALAGTAVEGTDFAIGSRTVRIPAGQTSANLTFSAPAGATAGSTIEIDLNLLTSDAIDTEPSSPNLPKTDTNSSLLGAFFDSSGRRAQRTLTIQAP